MQSRNINVIEFVDVPKAFRTKLQSWKRKIEMRYCARFEKLDMVLDSRGSKTSEETEKDILRAVVICLPTDLNF